MRNRPVRRIILIHPQIPCVQNCSKMLNTVAKKRAELLAHDSNDRVLILSGDQRANQIGCFAEAFQLPFA